MAGKLLQRLVGVLSIWVLAFGSLMVFAPVARVSAAQDCDANAVIYCGVTGLSDLITKYRQNQGGNLHAIFAHFGIPNEAYFNEMMVGRVTKNGEVYAGSELVATGAMTAGRQNMPGSTKIPGIEAYKRPPSVSFRSESLPALVKVVNGRFHSAVIMSCGNPVSANPVHRPKPAPKPQPKPQPKPAPKKLSLSIQKDVRISGETTWRQHVTADPGDSVEYRIIVTNTGDAPLTNLEIQDSLPNDVSFEDDNLEGSSYMRENTIGDLVGEGVQLTTLGVDASVELIFAATIGEEADACERPMKNIAYASARDVPEQKDDALTTVCQPEVPKPVVKAVQTPPPAQKLPDTGAAGAFALFSITSVLGAATYKLKELYEYLLR